MSNKTGRRSFLKNMGVSGTAAALFPTQLLDSDKVAPDNIPHQESNELANASHQYNQEYKGEFLNRVAFPLGGIGAGMICMEGTGTLSHVSIRNKPEIFNEPSVFAGIVIKGMPSSARVVEGPVPDWKKFGRANAGNGGDGTAIGLPHFETASFLARFPFATLDITDKDLSLKSKVTGWSPFIPTDEDNSSLPVAGLEYQFTNVSVKSLDAVFSFNSKNFLRIEKGKNLISSLKNGFVLSEMGTKEKPLRTDLAIFTDEENVTVNHCWFRGGWWDPFTMAWNAVKNAEINEVAPVESDAPGASLYIPFQLAAGKSKTIKILLAWYTPESDFTVGEMGNRKENCDPSSGCCNSPSEIGLDKYDRDFDARYYKPWYSSKFKDIGELTSYWLSNYQELRRKSALFRDAFFSSTLPPEVIEAIASNLTILKSPTVMRQFDGRLWNFEGCGDSSGCCHGSCTHVWNYAQAIPHLFPALERSLRATEFCENQDNAGHQNFRARLPIAPASHTFHAAADGQLGGIMKVYREWRISGDSEWMRKIYPMVKTSIDYCISTWDPHEKGIIEEPHHNTYDIEFWGPDGMHSSFYIGALDAISEMGEFLGNDVSRYRQLSSLGKKFMETELYNGQYFIQKIQFKGLKAKDPTTEKSFGGAYSDEAKKLMEKEGPKYQYGTGCLSDGVLGAWIARACGLKDPVDPTKLTSHLLSVHKYNLKTNLSEHANPQRPTFALGNEGGLLLCSWPKGGKLSLPFVYSDEVWTGIEHQVAAHLMMMGHVKEGLEIVRMSRNRYDGKIRNPFNEYECGHWYARALSSYGYLQALTGLWYDAIDKKLSVHSRVGDFVSFLSTATGFGTVTFKAGKATVKVAYGTIEIDKIEIMEEKLNTIKKA